MMATTPKREIAARIEAIANGPWTERSGVAEAFLRPRTDLRAFASSIDPVDLESLPLSDQDRRRERKIERVLRPHWKAAVVDLEEIDIRDSFDEALTELQLLELAVETGYLPIEAAALPARKHLLELLWSKGARRFVRAYDYVTVQWLADRFAVRTGDRAWRAPAPVAAEERFASFLAELRSWYEDENLILWLDFLDGYQKIGGEHRDFPAFLKGAGFGAKRQRFLERLLLGAQAFMIRLGDFVRTLSPEERVRYGSFHSFWLARFHGFDLEKEGYVADARTNWSERLLSAATRATEKGEERDLEFVASLIGDLEGWWRETCLFLEACR